MSKHSDIENVAIFYSKLFLSRNSGVSMTLNPITNESSEIMTYCLKYGIVNGVAGDKILIECIHKNFIQLNLCEIIERIDEDDVGVCVLKVKLDETRRTTSSHITICRRIQMIMCGV